MKINCSEKKPPKIRKRSKAIYRLLILSLVIHSCTLEKQRNLVQNSPPEPQDASTIVFKDSTASEDSLTEQSYVDPLFYIEGQLCQHVRKIFQDQSGVLWFGTNVYGLMQYKNDSLHYISEKEGLGAGRITGILEDQEGNVWFGTYAGLSKYDGKKFSNFSMPESFPSSEVWSLWIDRKGIFWIGTLEGLLRFDGEVFTHIPVPLAALEDAKSILSPNRITAIIEDKNGALWLGTDGYGICIYDGKSFRHMTTKEGLPDNTIYDLMKDKEGDIWIGTMFGGLSRFNGESFINYTERGLISGLEVGGLYEDKSGNIWFAAENVGVYRYDGTSFSHFTQADGLNSNGVLSILEDREGRFWFGGWGGLFRFDGSSFESVRKEGPWAE